MRTAGGEVFKPLVGPLFECFNVILDSDECNSDEYECLNEQVSHHKDYKYIRLYWVILLIDVPPR